jgi:hypothetical protein
MGRRQSKAQRENRYWASRSGKVVTYTIGDDKPPLPPGKPAGDQYIGRGPRAGRHIDPGKRGINKPNEGRRTKAGG